MDAKDAADRINAIFITIKEIEMKVQFLEKEMELRSGHLEAIIESERGTLKRQGERLRDEIQKVEKELRDILFNTKDGLIVRFDRIEQAEIDRKSHRNQMRAMWVSIVLLLIAFVLNYIKDHH